MMANNNAVDDTALLFAIMAGQPPQVPQRWGNLDGLRIGLPKTYFYDPLADDVQQAISAALQQLQADGAELFEIELPGIEFSSAVQFATLCSEATAVHWQQAVEAPETLGEDVRVRLEIGQFIPAIWYARAQGFRAQLASTMEEALLDVDLFLTPTLRTTAPAVGADNVSIAEATLPIHAAMTSLTLPFNLIGLPAITLPCGDGDDGLPIGLQLVAAAGRDWHVLAAAKRIETTLNYSRQG